MQPPARSCVGLAIRRNGVNAAILACSGLPKNYNLLKHLYPSTEAVEPSMLKLKHIQKLGVPSIQKVNAVAATLAVLLAIIAFYTIGCVFHEGNRSDDAHDRYEECTQAASSLMIASDYLTTQVGMYVVTGEPTYLDGYVDELENEQRRDHAVKTLQSHSGDDNAHVKITMAFRQSNKLAQSELYAMKLTALATKLSDMPQTLQKVELSQADQELPDDQKLQLARDMVLGEEYQKTKGLIVQNVNECTHELIESLAKNEAESDHRLDILQINLLVITILLVSIVGLTGLANHLLVVVPLRINKDRIENGTTLEYIGAQELRGVEDSYNLMYEENHRRTMYLQHAARTDPLTGLLNRGSYDRLLKQETENIALVLIDVDLFKGINDTYGHETGDKILQRVASVLGDSFRTTDHVCRIGGDEFAVIMTGITNVERGIIALKLEQIASELRVSQDNGLPAVTLSCGIALGFELEPGADIYHAADTALYQAKHEGRNRFVFYER